MQPHLGLVCITASKDVRYRTVTRKRLLEHSLDAQARLLEDLYRDNIQTFDNAMRYCEAEGIGLYRLPSSIFPFADEDIGRAVLAPFAETLGRSGRRATERGIRLVMHPDQFVVLNSDSEGVVANSVKILQMHADIMDLLEQPRSSWALLEIHGGKGNRADALVERIAQLPDAIRCRLGLENDEYAYGAEEIHDICMRAGVPMVFDAHHHVVHDRLDSYEHPSVGEMLRKARATWINPAHQLVHISNGREGFNDRQHSDLIGVMPSSYLGAPYIEIEAKMKEEAIRGLRAWSTSAGA
ncbi:UV damage endonuclease UvsE [Massilia agri]|uniref:UV damage endonuclease UvsE n=1 Tax=Massilia agri TaxID=1886785 RepID=A0ABT2ANX9_9BURK|nr:UV damage endonuclease UvsE [Massilia agri]MCS0597956.1 UV damage endonuclease UvsE [Massilia agri]